MYTLSQRWFDVDIWNDQPAHVPSLGQCRTAYHHLTLRTLKMHTLSQR